jgi:hypothetical protein
MYSRESEAREAARYLTFEVLLSNLRCGFFDQTCGHLGRGEFQGMTAACCPTIYAARPVGDFSPSETSFLKGEPPYRLYR